MIRKKANVMLILRTDLRCELAFSKCTITSFLAPFSQRDKYSSRVIVFCRTAEAGLITSHIYTRAYNDVL